MRAAGYRHNALRKAIMSKPEDFLGKKIDQFTLEAYIARGAMGMVFKAMDSVLARTVALKLIPKSSTDSLNEMERIGREEARKRLIQEAKAAGKLTHPNIVTIHSYGETDEFQYICMEYISGRTLAEVLRERGKIPVEEAIPIFEQILLALEAADQEGIVHRDIKPSNIMIMKGGRAKVMDFGIAKLPSLHMTVTGMILGTPFYMSPEQISGQKVDIRSDIFSLGAVIYETLTGEKPFTGESTATLTYKIIQVEPVPPNIINNLVPNPLSAIITRALVKDPTRRYQNPTQMLADLKSLSGASLMGTEVVSREAIEGTVLATRLERPKAKADAVSQEAPPAAAERPPAAAKAEKPPEEDGQEPTPKPAKAKEEDKAPKAAAPAAKEPKPAAREAKPNVQAAALVVVAILVGIALIISYLRGSPSPPAPPSVPPVTIPSARPPATQPYSAQPQPTPAVESLLLEAGKLFTSDPDRAQKLLEQALSQDPNNYDCAVALARLLSFKKDYAAAIRQYAFALSLDSRASDVHFELGSLLMAQGQYDQAIQSFESSLILQPKNRDDVLANLGFCHFKKGDYRKAKLLLLQSLEFNPNNSTAKAFLASIPTPTTQPPATEPPAKKPMITQPPATQPPPPPPKKVSAEEALEGKWDFTITYFGRDFTGTLDIAAPGDNLKLVSKCNYQAKGPDGLWHDCFEKYYFAGSLSGRSLTARSDHGDLTVDSKAVHANTPVLLNLNVSSDSKSLQGYVTNSQGVSSPLSVKKRK